MADSVERGKSSEGLRTPEIPIIHVEYNKPFKLLPLPELPSQLPINQGDENSLGGRKTLARYQLEIMGFPKGSLSFTGEYLGEAKGSIIIAASLAAAQDMYSEISEHKGVPSSAKRYIQLAGRPRVSFEPLYKYDDDTEAELVASEVPLVVSGSVFDINHYSDTNGTKLFAKYNGKVIDNSPRRNSQGEEFFSDDRWVDYERASKNSGQVGILYLPYNSGIFEQIEFVIGNQKPQP